MGAQWWRRLCPPSGSSGGRNLGPFHHEWRGSLGILRSRQMRIRSPPLPPPPSQYLRDSSPHAIGEGERRGQKPLLRLFSFSIPRVSRTALLQAKLNTLKDTHHLYARNIPVLQGKPVGGHGIRV
ncbi:unnamed protein product [Merluccius merluccius]